MKKYFTPKEVSRLTGLSYRQLQYWDKTGFISPSIRRAGKYRLYTFTDLVQLRLVKKLRKAKFSVQKLRSMLKSLKELLPGLNAPLAELTFLIRGEQIVVFNGQVLMNSISGQNYIRFDVREVKEEVERLFGPDAGEEADAGKEDDDVSRKAAG